MYTTLPKKVVVKPMAKTHKNDISNVEILQHMQWYASHIEEKIDQNTKQLKDHTEMLDNISHFMQETRAEFAANRHAHERFDSRITVVEKHAGLSAS